MSEENKDIEQTQSKKITKEVYREDIPNTMRGNTTEKSTSGPIVGVIIIVILFIVGGIYYWNMAVNKSKELNKSSAIQSEKETSIVVNQLDSQSTSDKITDIESDLNTTDLKNIDSGLNNLLNGL